MRHGRRTEHDVRLRTLALHVPRRGRSRPCRGHHERRSVASRDITPPRAFERLDQLLVHDIPRACDHDLRRMVGAGVKLLQLLHAELGHGLPGAQNRVSVGVRTPQLLVVQLEHEIVRRVVHHADLLEHDLTLEQQVLPAKQRPEDQVADDVDGFDEVLIEHARLIRGVLARGVRVERAAEHLERQRDLARRAVPRSLEHHVLEQMRDAHPLARLVHRSGTHPGAESNRPHSRHVLREYGQTIRQLSSAQP